MILPELKFIMDMEADEKYFIDDSEQPFLLLHGKSSRFTQDGANYTLFFADIATFNYKQYSHVKNKIDEFITKTIEKGKSVYRVRKNGEKKLVAKPQTQASPSVRSHNLDLTATQDKPASPKDCQFCDDGTRISQDNFCSHCGRKLTILR